jgi:Transposase
MNYVGIDWASGRAAWCAVSEGGAIEAEGLIPADEDGLARLVLRLGTEIRACVEMMSGAIWVRDQLQSAGWSVAVAHARKVRDIAPLACKTDKVDARVLAELCRRDLAAGGAMGGIRSTAEPPQIRGRVALRAPPLSLVPHEGITHLRRVATARRLDEALHGAGLGATELPCPCPDRLELVHPRTALRSRSGTR